MAHVHITLETEMLHELFPKGGRDEAFSRLLKTILNQVLSHQATEQTGQNERRGSLRANLDLTSFPMYR